MQDDMLVEAFRSPLVIVIYISMIIGWCVANTSPFGGDSTMIELDFTAYRLQQFDLQGTQYGTRAWRIMYEAAAIDSKSVLRRCIIAVWRDLVNRDLSRTFDRVVGAAIIIIPSDLHALSDVDRQHFIELERTLISQSWEIPIYLSPNSETLREIVAAVQSAQRVEQGSALAVLVNAVTANTFQITSSYSGNSAIVTEPLYNIVGKLSAYDRGGTDTSTIAIIAHYDSFGAAPSLAFGADSNGSGVAALLELMAVMHRFYQSARTRAKYNVIFVLTAGGKLNYQGSRHWIEDYIEHNNEASMKLDFVMCLDSLANDRGIYMHVSKTPVDTSPSGRFLSRLRRASHNRFDANRSVDIVSKKINLGSDFLAWEHERYSIRRLPAFTLSHYASHSNLGRRSMLDTASQTDTHSLVSNVQVIADALIAHMYNLPDVASCSSSDDANICSFLGESEGVQPDRLLGWFDRITTEPRAAQLLVGAKTPLLNDLHTAFDHYVHDAQLVAVSVDKKDAEYVLYGVVEDRLLAFRVKPAVFELVLAAMIAVYLALVYWLVLNVQSLIQYIQVETMRAKIS